MSLFAMKSEFDRLKTNGLLLLWFTLFGHKVCLGYPKKYGKMTQETQPQT